VAQAAPSGQSRGLGLLLGAVGLAGVVGLAAAADRLPSWSWSLGGVEAQLGPGRRVVDVSQPAPPNAALSAARPAGPQGQQGQPDQSGQALPRGARNALAPASGSSQTSSPPGSRYVFATFEEAEAFAGKSRAHLLAPRWVPPGFAPEPTSLSLSALTPEQAAILGRVQRVASTQRFVADDGLFTVVQSVPPPVFDLMADSSRSEDMIPLPNGQYAQFGVYPQGIIVYWRERGDARSVAIIADNGAAARLTRDDWTRLTQSLS
jgi:hypothetical protein